MISLLDFEGLAGFRWGVQFFANGRHRLSGRAPEDSAQKIALVGRIISQEPFDFGGADLIFERGKVLVRRGPFGLMILFCDEKTNVKMVDVILAEPAAGQSGQDSQTATSDKIFPPDPSQSSISLIAQEGQIIDASHIGELLDIYTRYLGPLARKLASKQCQSLGLDLARISVRDWPNLLNSLAARIASEPKREDFLDEAVMLKTKF